MSRNLENKIQERVRVLPDEQQREVLEFIEGLTIKARREEPARFSFVGIGRSGKRDLSTQAEAILERAADRREGWSLPE
jgi:hypothetical protein